MHGKGEGIGPYSLLLTLNFMLIALKSHLYNIGSKAAFNLREPERAEAAKRPSLRVKKIVSVLLRIL